MRPLNLTGQHFGRLSVIDLTEGSATGCAGNFVAKSS